MITANSTLLQTPGPNIWDFPGALLFPEDTGYFNGSRAVANIVNSGGVNVERVDIIVAGGYTTYAGAPLVVFPFALLPLLRSPYPTPWGASMQVLYFDVLNDMRVMIAPIGATTPTVSSCMWWDNGVTSPISTHACAPCPWRLSPTDRSLQGRRSCALARCCSRTLTAPTRWWTGSSRRLS